jgi:hypothetical protein
MSYSFICKPQAIQFPETKISKSKRKPEDLLLHRLREIEDIYRLLLQMPSMNHPKLNLKSGSDVSWLISRTTPLVKKLLDAVTLVDEKWWGFMKSHYDPGEELYYPEEICLLRLKVEKKIALINDHLQKLELPMIGE